MRCVQRHICRIRDFLIAAVFGAFNPIPYPYEEEQ